MPRGAGYPRYATVQPKPQSLQISLLIIQCEHQALIQMPNPTTLQLNTQNYKLANPFFTIDIQHIASEKENFRAFASLAHCAKKIATSSVASYVKLHCSNP